jgi:hypothetical protein
MMITMGALMLLALVILRVNTGYLNTDSVMLDSKLGVLAVSVATSIIEEAQGKAFDEATDSVNATVATELTTAAKLGPESGEVYPNFDDFDDFNGYSRIDNTLPAAQFKMHCRVDYIEDTDPDKITNTRTWNKKITVYVTSPSFLGQDDIPDTVVMSAIQSYWYFR